MPISKKIVIANWKMNPLTSKEAIALVKSTKNVVNKLKNTETVICPPFLYFNQLVSFVGRSKKLSFGAQSCFFEEKGAFTGEISATMIKRAGGTKVIVGHSERRAMGESNDTINKKVKSVIDQGLSAVLCVGESGRDQDGLYLGFLREQINSALLGIPRQKLTQVMIAYEPIWAIGKGASSAMEPRDVHETALFIRKILKDLYKNNQVLDVPVLYGGSVAVDNTSALMQDGDIQGLLVGHKSLEPIEFGEILNIIDKN